MLRAGRAVALTAKTGQPLPQVGALRDLYAHGNDFYRGGVHMIGGQPASMKSGFMLWYLAQANLPAIYFSADSDPATQTSRLVAMATGESSRLVRDEFQDAQARSQFAELLDESRIHWCFDANPDWDNIEDEVSAYVEFYDAFPDVLVFDNLMDVYSSSESETRGYKDNLLWLKDLARRTGAAVFVLHHAKEGMTDPKFPGSLKSLQGMVGQTPSFVLSVARDNDVFRLAPVKDRNGPDDKSGETFFEMRIDPSTCRFEYMAPLSASAAVVAQGMAGHWSPSAWGE